MPFDLRLQRTCEHLILDEQATIQGLSPSYFSILSYLSDGASNFVSAREFASTEGLSSYAYMRDGFTNWRLSSDGRQINWNSSGLGGPGTGVASFLDGSSFVLPPPAMLVSYRTKTGFCPLCLNSMNLSKDVDFDQHGKLRTLSGNDKVRQMIFKALLTELGSNDILPDYGSTLSASIGQKFDTLTELRIYNSVQTAVQFLIREQLNQPGLPLDETILNVTNVGVAQDVNDPRIIRVTMQVQVANFTKVQVNFNLLSS